jgi:hypothetical protein
MTTQASGTHRAWLGATLALGTAVGVFGCAKILGDFTSSPAEPLPEAGGSTGTGGSPIRDAAPDRAPLRDAAPDALCAEGARLCQGQDIFTCTGGGFVFASTCPYLCTGGNCVGTCNPADTRCVGTSLQTCSDNGTWGSSQPCTFANCVGGPGTEAGPAACIGTCTPGSTMCSDGRTLSTCDRNGVYQPTPCSFVCSSDGQTAACTGMCVPQATQCNGDNPQVCDNTGNWVTGPECTTHLCDDGGCAGMCTVGTKQCNNNTVQTCVAGMWVDDPSPCTFACLGGACTTCALGTSVCNGGNVQSCLMDGGTSLVTCPFACVVDRCGGECHPGTTRCNVKDSGAPVQQACSPEGQWYDNGDCINACLGTGCGGDCPPGAKQCNAVTNAPEICSSSAMWIPNGTCPRGCQGAGICTPVDGGTD